MTVPTFKFCGATKAAFHSTGYGSDPYTPGSRYRELLGDVLSWGIDPYEVRHAVQSSGAAYITNLPCDLELPPSPPEGKRPSDKKTAVSENLLNAMSALLKLHPVAYHNEKDGDLIHQIVPLPGREASVSNQGAGRFQMHTEATHTAFPPDVLALVCVRNTERGETNFASLDRAMYGASHALIAELRQPNFTQLMGVSSGGGGRYRLPILSGPYYAPIYRVDFTDVEATNPVAERALEEFMERARACEERVVLQPGDMIVINNHRAIHGRVGFTPDYSNGEQRWLQRQYMTSRPTYGKPFDDRYPHVWCGDG